MTTLAEHFEDMEKQAHAAKLGMGVFLASEVLFFAGLFTLTAAYQNAYPAAFHLGIEHNTRTIGSINTGILLVSSALVAGGVHALRRGKTKLTVGLVSATLSLGVVFLVLKMTEYGVHFREGIYPGGSGRFFTEHPVEGIAQFWTLYYFITGLHALHVTIGVGVLAFMVHGVAKGEITKEVPHRLEVGALYWHLVDVIWIFVWPLYYLA